MGAPITTSAPLPPEYSGQAALARDFGSHGYDLAAVPAEFLSSLLNRARLYRIELWHRGRSRWTAGIHEGNIHG